MYHGEKFNSITHLVGTVLSVAGGGILLTTATIHGAGLLEMVAFSIYSLTLTLLYTFSTLYHSFVGRVKDIFQKLDHVAIYLLIAGTYTPFTIITLQGTWGWWIFGINWALALFGIAQEFWLGKRSRILSLVIYVVMGWMIVFASKPLIANLPHTGLMLLGAGGITYTAGIVFYVLDDRIKHAHGIWHLFVLGGSILQYLCVLLYLA